MAQYRTVITSKHSLFDLHIKETFSYRDLISLFVKRDFTSKYKQTVLGPLWAIIQPLLTTVVFTIIFGELAGLPTGDLTSAEMLKLGISENQLPPRFLFFMSGNICWAYFSLTLHNTSNTFIANSAIMGKVYYPRLVTPISTAFSNLISFFIQFAMFLCIWLVYLIKGGTCMRVTPWMLFIPLLILQMIILSVGFGIIISSVTTKYRDLAMLVTFGLQLWQYGSPIAYGLQLVNEKKHSLMALYMLNPVTPIITTFRKAMYGFGYFNLTYYLISWAVTLVVFFAGLIMFSRIERTFMDTI